MVKFTILFHKPTVDPEWYEIRYNEFLALIERMPNIQRRQVNRVLGGPGGESTYERLLEVYFDNYPSLDAALRSKAGQEAGAHLQQFPRGSFEMFFADVYEEAGGQTPPITPTKDEHAGA